MLVVEAGAAEEAAGEGEVGVVVLEEPLAVSGGDPEDVSAVAVAPAGLAVAIAPGVVGDVVGCASSPPCGQRRSCDCVSKFSS